jgi:hypothetical protein
MSKGRQRSKKAAPKPPPNQNAGGGMVASVGLKEQNPNRASVTKPTYSTPEYTNFVLSDDLYPEITPQTFKDSGTNRYYAYGSTQNEYSSFCFDRERNTGYTGNLLQRIQQAINYSPTNGAILTSKANYAFGGQILLDEKSPNYKRNLQVIEDTNLQAVLQAVGYDYFAYNTAFVQIKRDSANGGVHIGHLEIDYTRIKSNGQYKPTQIGFSYNWYMGGTGGDNVLDVNLFSPTTHKYGQSTYDYAIMVKGKTEGRMYWAISNWFAAMPSCEIEYHAPKNDSQFFKNGCKIGGALGVVTDSAQDEEALLELKEGIKDPQRAHDTIVFSMRGSAELSGNRLFYTPIRAAPDKSQIDLTNAARDVIVRTHRIAPALAGIETAGKLGSNQNLQTEFEILLNGQLRPAQQKVISDFLKPVFRELDAVYKTTLYDDFIGLEAVLPATLRGEIQVNETLTRDERRELIGYQPLTVDQQAQETAQMVQKVGAMGKVTNFLNSLKFW